MARKEAEDKLALISVQRKELEDTCELLRVQLAASQTNEEQVRRGARSLSARVPCVCSL